MIMTVIAKKIPALRFPEFEGEWEIKKVEQVLKRVGKPVAVENDQLYQQIGIRSHGKGLFHKEFVTGEELGGKRVFWVVPDSFIVNIVFAWEQAVAKTTAIEEGMIASHRFPMFQSQEKHPVDLDFILHFFLTNKGKVILEAASPGGAGRNKTLGQKEFERQKIFYPTLPEQQKIAAFLTTIDTRIQQLSRKKVLLEQYKKGVMQQIFSQEIRFKDKEGKEFPAWEEKELGELLKYEQPTKYIVESTEYRDDYPTPVLTAGKTFILGFTDETKGVFNASLDHPVIIFDDFTTAFQFVSFPFKVKSSAMKILKPANSTVLMKFVFEVASMLKVNLGEDHKRYWISEYSKLRIPYPSLSEQQKIADFLSTLDRQINLVSQQLERMQSFKKGLLQQMFV